MNRNECEEFYNELVTIGVPHKTQNRLFYHTGFVKTVTDTHLELKIKDGYRRILLEDIIEIRRGL